MENINDLLTKLASGSTSIISNPNTIELLKKKGIAFDNAPKTLDDYLDTLFGKRRRQATDIMNKFPNAPKVAILTIGFLYDEIRECILFGLNGAAISLCAVLVEFSLKHAIVKRNSKDAYDTQEWDRVEHIELGPTITEAKELALITVKQEQSLIKFKNEVRNPYLHYNIKKLTKDVVANKVKKVDIVTQKVEEVDIPAIENPLVWGESKKFVDRETVIDRFLFADQLVKILFEDKK